MDERSWLRNKKIFYVLLVLVFISHISLLAIHFNQVIQRRPSPTQKTALKVKILDQKTSELITMKRQIVESEDSDTNERPQDSRFLGDKDRSFLRQTVAKRIGPFQKSALGDAAVTYQGEKKKNKSRQKNIKLSDLGALAGRSHPLQKAAEEFTRSQKGIRSGDRFSRGVSSSSDFTPDVPLGDLTHLNTVEYKYYGFYHRIRQKLEQFWGRSIQEKAAALAKQGRRVASDSHLITSLQITLDHQGEILAIRVTGPSGVRELDDAAIESFNKAGPFPNPPKDLIVDGKVTLEWGFVVKS